MQFCRQSLKAEELTMDVSIQRTNFAEPSRRVVTNVLYENCTLDILK